MPGSKYIISAKDVRDRYSLQDLADINSAINSGITAAHIFFQGILGTEFEEVVGQTDVFRIDEEIIPAYNEQYRLRLKRAFVKPGAIAISTGKSRKEATNAMAAGDFIVDHTRGLVFIDKGDTNYNGSYVSITYTAGFGTDEGAVVAPGWLKEALLSWMSSVMVFSAYKEEPAKALPISEAIKREAVMMVDRYKRETALQFLPIY